MRHGRRTATAGTALLVALGLGAAPALAGVVARAAGGSTATSSASWGAQAGAVGAGPATGSYVVVFNQGNPVPPQFFSVYNTGTRSLTAQTYTAVNSRPSTGNAPPETALDACLGATWNAATNTCAGTVLRLTTSTQSATTANAPLASGAVLSVRAAPITHANFPQEFRTTVTVAVSRSHAGAATTTSS